MHEQTTTLSSKKETCLNPRNPREKKTKPSVGGPGRSGTETKKERIENRVRSATFYVHEQHRGEGVMNELVSKVKNWPQKDTEEGTQNRGERGSQRHRVQIVRPNGNLYVVVSPKSFGNAEQRKWLNKGKKRKTERDVKRIRNPERRVIRQE